MSGADHNRNGDRDSSGPADEPQASRISQRAQLAEVGGEGDRETEYATRFATRAEPKTPEAMSKARLALVGGGLLTAILFFVLTAVVEKSPKHLISRNHSTQESKPETSQLSKGSVTPLMETERTPAPDNASGQLGPGDIRRTRSSSDPMLGRLSRVKPVPVNMLGNIPSFAETQQKWEDPAPYETISKPEESEAQQNSLKEPSIIFVRSEVQKPIAAAPTVPSSTADVPRLDLALGTRIQAKLETQISSAVQAPVVAVVEYTYAIGDKVIVPAGARVYGQLQQADRSGLVSVKFDEVQLLDGAREKIDAVGTDLNLGPIRGEVYGKHTGRNFLVRAASGLGSVLADVAGNNTSAAFSEDDMLRERLAENIGTAGDSEVMSLNANSRVVVSVPADTKIYIVFTKHEQTPAELHKLIPQAQ